MDELPLLDLAVESVTREVEWVVEPPFLGAEDTMFVMATLERLKAISPLPASPPVSEPLI